VKSESDEGHAKTEVADDMTDVTVESLAGDVDLEEMYNEEAHRYSFPMRSCTVKY